MLDEINIVVEMSECNTNNRTEHSLVLSDRREQDISIRRLDVICGGEHGRSLSTAVR